MEADRVIDWRASTLADVDALPASRTPRRDELVGATTDFRVGAYGAVLEAARGRKVTLAAYIRRAAYAMAAHDLGIGLQELTTRDERMANARGFSVADPDGDRFGEWEIDLLRGEERP